MVFYNDKNSDDIRSIIAQNLYFYRKRSHLTQEEVAKAIGLTYQQIQKYEKGKNRVSADVLYKLGRLYGVCLQQFFWKPDLN